MPIYGARRKRRAKRWILVGLVVGLALGTLWFGRERFLLPPLVRIATFLARGAGYELVLEEPRGDLLSSLGARSLRIRALRAGLPLRSLDATELQLEFSLWRLLGGDPLFLSSLEAESVALDVHLDQPTLDMGAGNAGGAGGFPSLAGALPQVHIEHLAFALRIDAARHLALDGARLTAESGDNGRVRVALDARELVYVEGDQRTELPLALRAEWRRGRVELEHLDLGGWEPLGRATANLANLGRSRASADVEFALTDGELELAARWLEDRVELRLLARRFDLAQATAQWAEGPLGSLVAPLAGVPWPTGPWRVDADVSLPLGDGQTVGEARLLGQDLDVAGRAVERLEARLGLEGHTLTMESFDLVGRGNSLSLRDVLVDLEATEPERRFLGSTGRVRLELTDLAALLAPGAVAPRDLPEHRVSAVAGLEEGRLRLLEGRFDTPGGAIRLSRGQASIHVGEVPNSGAAAPIELRYALEGRADFTSLEPLTRILALGPFAGSLSGNLAVDGRGTLVTASADLGGRDLVAAGWPLGDVQLAAELTPERLELRRLVTSLGPERIDVAGSLLLPRDGAELAFEDVRVEAHLEQLLGHIRTRLVPGAPPIEGLTVRGSLGGPWTRPVGELSASATGVDWAAERFDLVELDLAARAEPGGAMVFDGLRARATSPIGQISALAEATVRDGALDLSLREFEISRGEQTLELERPSQFRSGPEGQALDELRLSGSAGALAVSMAGSPAGYTIDFEAGQLNLEPFAGRFLPVGLEALGLDLTGNVQLDGGGQWIGAAVDGELGHLRPAAHLPSSRVQVHASWGEGRLLVRELLAESEAGDRVELRGDVPLRLGGEPFHEGPVEVVAAVDAPGLARWLPDVLAEGAGLARLSLNGTWDQLEGALLAEGTHLLVATEGVVPAGFLSMGRADGSLSARLGPSGIWIDEWTVAASAAGTASVAGSVATPAGLPAWLAATRDEFAATPIALTADVDLHSLVWLRDWLPEVRNIGGRARLEDVVLRGPLFSPTRSGTLEVEEGLVKFDSDLPAISDLAGTLLLSQREVAVGRKDDAPREWGDVLEVVELRARAGGSPLELTGWFAPLTSQPVFALNAVGQDLLLYRTPDTTVRADAELALTGSLDALLLAGSIEPTSSRFTRNVNFLSFGRAGRPATRGARGIELFSFRNAPLSTMAFDVRVRAREPFRIDNNFVKGSLLPDLWLRGTGELPVLEGPIYLQTTRVALPATRLRFTGGTITFERENPFVPRLNLRAETRVLGYDVEIQVLGPYDDPEIVMSSVPPLPPQDVAILVATGQLPASALTMEGGERTARLVAIYLAQDFSSQFFSDGDGSEASFLERFEVSTGRDLSRSGQETIEGSFQLWEDRIVDGDQGLITVERDVFDDYNFGLRLVLRMK